MAKFKVEVDLDWMDSETTIDDEIRDEVIRGARDYLLKLVKSYLKPGKRWMKL